MCLFSCRGVEPEAPRVVVEPPMTAWDLELEDVDRDIAATRARLDARPDQWVVESQLAALYAERGRLTGDYEDYGQAEAALERAFDVAPTGSGPFLQRAALNFSLHRLDAVEPDLLAAENRGHHTAETAAQVALMRGRVHMERGHYAAARSAFQRSNALAESVQGHAALAHHAWQTGDPVAAEAALTRAESLYHGLRAEPRAWFHLQRAIADLDSDRYEESLAHLADADEALPGYWLIEEHVAEIRALQGDLHGALDIYRSVVERTGSPELMGAMAGVLADLGETSEASDWVRRADLAFAERLEDYPEAATGHALEHALEYGDPEEALALAEANAALRPNGPALDLLAQAYLKADRPEEARATARRAAALGWGGQPSVD